MQRIFYFVVYFIYRNLTVITFVMFWCAVVNWCDVFIVWFFLRFTCCNFLLFNCLFHYLSGSVVVLALFLTVKSKWEVWLALKPGSTPPFLVLKISCTKSWISHLLSAVCFYVDVCFCFCSVFLLCHCWCVFLGWSLLPGLFCLIELLLLNSGKPKLSLFESFDAMPPQRLYHFWFSNILDSIKTVETFIVKIRIMCG